MCSLTRCLWWIQTQLIVNHAGKGKQSLEGISLFLFRGHPFKDSTALKMGEENVLPTYERPMITPTNASSSSSSSSTAAAAPSNNNSTSGNSASGAINSNESNTVGGAVTASSSSGALGGDGGGGSEVKSREKSGQTNSKDNRLTKFAPCNGTALYWAAARGHLAVVKFLVGMYKPLVSGHKILVVLF
jgi:hypothetical protein